MAAEPEERNGETNNVGKSRELEKGTSETEVVVLDSDCSESHVDGGDDSTAKTGGIAIVSGRSSCVHRIPPFLKKIYDMLGNDEINYVVSWSCTGTSFVIKNSHLFAADILPIYFRHNNFQSFITQLNSYGFKKISWEKWEYRNEYFRKGEEDLLKNIKRRDYISSRMQPSSDMRPSVSTSAYSGDIVKEHKILMKEHHQVKTEIMKLKENHRTLEGKFASLREQVMSNQDCHKRMMLIAQRILNKQTGEPMLEENRGTDQKNLKGKRKLEAESATTQDNKGKVLLDEEEMEKHQPNTFISLEDLFGESSDWIEYHRELQEKANHLQS